MTPFTLVMAYYENAGMLREQVRLLLKLPDTIAANLSLVVVDDGSPTAPAYEAVADSAWCFLQARLAGVQIWRMGVDVAWNQDACRNVGMRETLTRWAVLTDMDHVVPLATWQFLMQARGLERETAYKFARVNAPAGDPYKPHPNSWAMSRELYWAAGGYDEALAGYYGTDGDFKVRLQRIAPIVDLAVPIVRYPREVIPDASTTTYERKKPGDRETIGKLVKARISDPRWQPLHFAFPCARVL